jgi:chromosome segregation ATPase
MEENGRLIAANNLLKTKRDELIAENGRLTTARDQLGERLAAVTNELNALRAELGTLTPADVRLAAAESDSLRTEAERLRDEHAQLCRELSERAHQSVLLKQSEDALKAARSQVDLLTAQFQERETSLDSSRARVDAVTAQVQERENLLDAARAQLDALTAQIRERETELDKARAEVDRLTTQLHEGQAEVDHFRAETKQSLQEREAASEKITALETLVAERERTERELQDQLRTQAESHELAAGRVKEMHDQSVEALDTKLAILANQHAMLQQDHRATTESAEQLRIRNEELVSAQERLAAEYQSMLDCERTTQQRLTDELSEVRARLDENTRLAAQSASTSDPVEGCSDSESGDDGAFAQVEDLKRKLVQAEQINRDMSEILGGMGIRYRVSG